MLLSIENQFESNMYDHDNQHIEGGFTQSLAERIPIDVLIFGISVIGNWTQRLSEIQHFIHN